MQARPPRVQGQRAAAVRPAVRRHRRVCRSPLWSPIHNAGPVLAQPTLPNPTSCPAPAAALSPPPCAGDDNYNSLWQFVLCQDERADEIGDPQLASDCIDAHVPDEVADDVRRCADRWALTSQCHSLAANFLLHGAGGAPFR